MKPKPALHHRSSIVVGFQSSTMTRTLPPPNDRTIKPTGTTTSLPAKGGADQIIIRKVPAFVYALNSSTKWLVSLANIIGVWCRPQRFHGPFIVVGSIAAVYFTAYLKKVINQGRPDGSPFTDPGMPSSHSLVSFFLAISWSRTVLVAVGGSDWLLMAVALVVAGLRVICGYHSVAQIAVGAVLGTLLGHGWVLLGDWLHGTNPQLAFALAWSAYLAGSTVYIRRDMRKWVAEDKHL
jgi:membrane-associated phospholipid phosphatase